MKQGYHYLTAAEKEEVGVTEQQVIKEFEEDFKEKELKKETFQKRPTVGHLEGGSSLWFCADS